MKTFLKVWLVTSVLSVAAWADNASPRDLRNEVLAVLFTKSRDLNWRTPRGEEWQGLPISFSQLCGLSEYHQRGLFAGPDDLWLSLHAFGLKKGVEIGLLGVKLLQPPSSEFRNLLQQQAIALLWQLSPGQKPPTQRFVHSQTTLPFSWSKLISEDAFRGSRGFFLSYAEYSRAWDTFRRSSHIPVPFDRAWLKTEQNSAIRQEYRRVGYEIFRCDSPEKLEAMKEVVLESFFQYAKAHGRTPGHRDAPYDLSRILGLGTYRTRGGMFNGPQDFWLTLYRYGLERNFEIPLFSVVIRGPKSPEFQAILDQQKANAQAKNAARAARCDLAFANY